MSNWSRPAGKIPRPNPGCSAILRRFDRSAASKHGYYVDAVSKTGATISILRDDGKVLKAKRVRVRLPRELGPEDISPTYYASDIKGRRYHVRLGR